MSKEQNEIDKLAPKVETPAPMTMEAIMQLFLEQQKEAAADRQALIEAVLEGRKPYVDPAVIRARQQMAEDRKALVAQHAKQIAINKKVCPHMNEGGKYNIKWHQHSNGIILGVCGTCFSQFDATHSREDAGLFRLDLKAQRNMGRAGEHARRGTDIAL